MLENQVKQTPKIEMLFLISTGNLVPDLVNQALSALYFEVMKKAQHRDCALMTHLSFPQALGFYAHRDYEVPHIFILLVL